MEPSLPETNNGGNLTLLVILVELVNEEMVRSAAVVPPRGGGASGTYGELIVLSWFNGPILGQTLDDGDGAIEFRLSRHCRISR